MNGVSIVERSGDRKLSANRNVSATWVAQQSCHSDCPLFKNGCYAEMYHAGVATARLNRKAKARKLGLNTLRTRLAKEEAKGIAGLSGQRKLRVHVVGDCATRASARIVGQAMVDYGQRHGKAAWTYTHSWRRIPVADWRGAAVLASCETSAEVRQAQARGYAAALITPDHPTNKVYSYQGLNILPCPAQFLRDGKRTVTCEDCSICQRPDMLKQRGLVVGFQPDMKLVKKKIYRLIGVNDEQAQTGSAAHS